MAKRFTDTDKYKKAFMRGLPGPYKLLWDYLYHDCDYAGIWHKDFEVAQIYLGKDMEVTEEKALELFNQGEERIKVLEGGKKWLVLPFIGFQYGRLNPENRVHSSILYVLSKAGIKDLASPLEGAKEKEKEKEQGLLSLERGKERKGERVDPDFEQFWIAYPKKRSRGMAFKAWRKLNPSKEQVNRILAAVDQAKRSVDWAKEGGQYIPYPASWLNAQGWEDEISMNRQDDQKARAEAMAQL